MLKEILSKPNKCGDGRLTKNYIPPRLKIYVIEPKTPQLNIKKINKIL